ncbi:MAG: ribonuclease HI family protein [Gemmataceae bacterium]|uniref:Ribonuclease HI family protein n=1 Tax=Thermogemmata fonticola TaxID=2755323 RepID=A0A7V8VDJ5_9BACT|nr:ribonuclease HI family protein [Thermogemmata fonticola]MBA2225986.1 ribonuclease HI family protein [Thermogemmata fonticola]MCX8138399.1 ribonuclease HI family protein [Gemmataceae bacterium]
MSEGTRLYIDGAARGNPGPAAYAVILQRPGQPPLTQAAPIGTATNNVAEYTALLEGLRLAAAHKVPCLEVISDSELLVKQMQGHYRVRHPELQRLYQAVHELLPHFQQVTFTHVRRDQNAEADRLANAALDGRLSAAGSEPPSSNAAAASSQAASPQDRPRPPAADSAPSDGPARLPLPSAAYHDIHAILHSAAQTWAAQGLPALPVDQVWEQIQSVLEEHRLLHRPRRSQQQ